LLHIKLCAVLPEKSQGGTPMAGRNSQRMPKKKKTKNVAIYCVVIALLTVVACVSGRYKTEHPETNDGIMDNSDAEFQVHVMDVGQGDSILVLADGEAMLIDASESTAAAKITDYLSSQGVTKLQYAAATHMHADHIGGFPKILDTVQAETIIEPVFRDALTPTTKAYERYLDIVEESGAEYRTMQAGDSFTLGGAEVSVLAPVSDEADTLNNTSLVLRVEYDGIVCLFTGDMETEEETSLLQSGADIKADFLKVGHHGSTTSSGEAFLEAVQPAYAAISCGADNSYGHPAESTLERLAAYTDNVYVTAEDGDIIFLYDKETKSCSIITENEE
jgi:competence protein ComEC